MSCSDCPSFPCYKVVAKCGNWCWIYFQAGEGKWKSVMTALVETCISRNLLSLHFQESTLNPFIATVGRMFAKLQPHRPSFLWWLESFWSLQLIVMNQLSRVTSVGCWGPMAAASEAGMVPSHGLGTVSWPASHEGLQSSKIHALVSNCPSTFGQGWMRPYDPRLKSHLYPKATILLTVTLSIPVGVLRDAVKKKTI